MNAKNELKPTLTVDILNKYANCMEEIKLRKEVIEEFMDREFSAQYLRITVESVSLQFRKMLELIALASLVANKFEYEKYHENFKKHWKAKKILGALEKANPNFYPFPWEPAFNPDTGADDEMKPITSGYLTKEDFINLYDKCSNMLHASNPFSEEQQDPMPVFNNTTNWLEKIRVLLNRHLIQLVDKEAILVVTMKTGDDGSVDVREFRATD